MKKEILDLITFHALFSIFCVIILISTIPIGFQLFILVLIYNISIPILGLVRKHESWISMWTFSFILSLFQIWPDWILASQLEILVFPPDGFIKIGSVSAYMAGLWSIPFFIILFIGNQINNNTSEKIHYLIIGLLSLVIFGIAEQSMWLLGSWYAINVSLLGFGAIYIIIPEIILGLTTYYGYKLSLERSLFIKITSAFIIMIIYLGNAVSFYFLFEKLIFV